MEGQDGDIIRNRGSRTPGNHSPAILYTSKIFSLTAKPFYYTALFILSLSFPLIFSLKIFGRKNLRSVARAILVTNHSLYLDPAVSACASRPKRLYFSGMEPTFTETKKPFQLFIRLLGGFPIPSKNPYSIIPPVSRLLDGGSFIQFYPEGKMTYLGKKLKPFKPGAFYTAYRTAAHIIPLCIITKRRRYWFPKISVHILDPVDPAAYTSYDAAASPDAAADASTDTADAATAETSSGAAAETQLLPSRQLKKQLLAMAEDVRRDMQRTIDIFSPESPSADLRLSSQKKGGSIIS